MLMAAGLGTRLRPYSDSAPKALTPVMGIPSSDFSLRTAASHGFERVVANVHHLADTLELELTGLASRAGVSIEFSDERARLLGSAGGLKKALPRLLRKGERRFLVLNADVLCDVDLGALLRHHLRLREQWGVSMTLAVFPSGPWGGKYREMIWDKTSSLLSSFGSLESGRPFFVGAAVLEQEALEAVPEDEACDFVPKILVPELSKRKVGVFGSQGIWFDLGSPELWWRTHLEFLARLELGALPLEWRQCIEAANERVGERSWVRTGVSNRAKRSMQGPGSYFDPDGVADAKASCGSDGIQYGALDHLLERGIARFGKVWKLESEASSSFHRE